MRSVFRDALFSAAVLALSILISLWFDSLGFNEANIVTLSVLAVLVIAAFTSRRIYGLVASVFNVFAFNFLFAVPRFSLAFQDAGYLITFIVMFAASFVTSTLTIELKAQAKRSAVLALQAEREAMRTALLRTISHDLRTPLTSISGSADMLVNSGAVLSEAQKNQLCAGIYSDAKWLIGLIENLLSLTRIENGNIAINLQPELVGEVVEEALRHIDRRASEHRIVFHGAQDWQMALMDSQLIVQVIVNLVNNAIAYSGQGSTITIAAQRRGGDIVVEVADDGVGIPAAIRDRLFEWYVTGDDSAPDGRRGLGLGLPLCRAILALHGGEIGVRDNAPHGTVFYFSLRAQEVSDNE